MSGGHPKGHFPVLDDAFRWVESEGCGGCGRYLNEWDDAMCENGKGWVFENFGDGSLLGVREDKE